MEEELSENFITYGRQSHAFTYQNEHPGTHVFSYETPELSPGSRRFLAANPRDFFQFYTSCRHGRHFYELIRDGYPCRPYFDLEFNRKDNPEVDAEQYLDDFLTTCSEVFMTAMRMNVKREAYLLLDSSTEDKFSIHVIIHLPNGLLFPQNTDLKDFITLLCQTLADKDQCIIKKGEKEEFICDQCVYTRNRNFRLFYSSKCGKVAKLKYKDGCNFYASTPNNSQLFFDALIIPENYKEFPVVEETILDRIHVLAHKDQNVLVSRIKTRGNIQNDNVRNLAKAAGDSPFPELDAFVLNLFRQFCPNVQIKEWTLMHLLDYDRRRIEYQFNNCRHCFNIGREHKSNNICAVADLFRFDVYQRCFDQDCYGFRSNYFPVPKNVEEKIRPKMESVFIKYGAPPQLSGLTRLLSSRENVGFKEDENPHESSFYDPESDRVLLDVSIGRQEKKKSNEAKKRAKTSNSRPPKAAKKRLFS